MKGTSIVNIFDKPPEDPFVLELNVKLIDSKPETFYLYIRDLYIKGLSSLTGNKNPNSVCLENITSNHIELMRKYMLSFGIDSFYNVYTTSELNFLIKDLMYEIEKFKNVDSKVTTNLKTREITSVILTINKLKYQECKGFCKILQKHNIANMILKFYNPEVLRDFGFIFKPGHGKIYIVYFDFADRSLYNKRHSFGTQGNF